MHHIRNASTATVVRAQLVAAGLGDRAADGARRRLDRLREDPEEGAQAAEYAMLGGVSAGACGALVILLRREETLKPLVDGVLQMLLRAVRSWFS